MSIDQSGLGGLKFRKRLFWGLALLVLAFMALMVFSPGTSYEDAIAQSGYEAGSLQAESYALGTSIAWMAVVCVGTPVFVVFALLGWRNGVGLRQEIRHREMMAKK